MKLKFLSQTIPAVNQVECHAYLNQDKMLALCKRYGIIITAYSPLGSPSRPVNKPNANDKGLLGEPKVLALAKKYNRTPAQILLRYQVISSSIFGSNQPMLIHDTA